MQAKFNSGVNFVYLSALFAYRCLFAGVTARDEDRIQKACYWPHESYESCFAGCAEITCDNPVTRQRPCYPYCEPGCICRDPYVRDDRTHTCVLPSDCSVTQMGIPVKSTREEKTRRREVPNLALVPGDLSKHSQADYARLGNYFNIVIAPPPIRAFENRKMKGHDKKKGFDDGMGSRKDVEELELI